MNYDEENLLDELKWKHDKRIAQKTKENDVDAFLLSAEVMSYKNAKNKKLKIRNLLLTKKFLYFISEFTFCMINTFSIKRKIPVKYFEKVTLGKNSRECVLHIKDQDDIFLSSAGGKRSKDEEAKSLEKFQRILKEIDKAYTNQTNKNLPVFILTKQAGVELKGEMMSGKLKKKIATKKITKKKNYTTAYANQRSKNGEEPIYKSYKLVSENFVAMKGIKVFEFYKEMVVKLKEDDALYTCKIIDISDVCKLFSFEIDTLHDLMKNYLPISSYINDIFLAYMNKRTMTIHSPFLKGGKLSTHIKEGKFRSEAMAKQVISQIVNALDVLHNRGITVGILNPNLIGFNEKGQLVFDIIWNIYKLKKRIDTDRLSREILMYCAPELSTNETTRVSDWWSVGTILYELIYGFNPFYHQSKKMVKKLKASGKIFFTCPENDKAEVSSECKDLIRKLMKKNLRLRLGWKNGGVEIKSHSWFKGFDWKDKTEHIEIFDPSFNDPYHLDYIDTDDVMLCMSKL